jgi:hypothetical protein
LAAQPAAEVSVVSRIFLSVIVYSLAFKFGTAKTNIIRHVLNCNAKHASTGRAACHCGRAPDVIHVIAENKRL